jgi:glycerate kinase
MRVVVAPSSFAGTLSAAAAARAIAAGWVDTAPGDTLVQLPVSGGGPGLLEAVQTGVEHAGGAAVLSLARVSGPDGRTPVPAAMLAVADTVWVEAAQVCGVDVLGDLDPRSATSRGLGELLAIAAASGARAIVVGLGGCVVADGGRGLFAALAGGDPLDGPAARLHQALGRLAGVDLVAAGTSDDPLDPGSPARPFADALTAGLRAGGAVPPEEVTHHHELDDLPLSGAGARRRALPLLGSRIDRALPDRPGAGAGSGLGLALLALGARYRAGVEEVLAATGLPTVVADCDLVLTGEGSFDHRSRAGSAVGGVAAAAGAAGVPCVVLAGRTMLGSRETRAVGVGSAYAVQSLPGWRDRDPTENLRLLAARAARTWSVRGSV